MRRWNRALAKSSIDSAAIDLTGTCVYEPSLVAAPVTTVPTRDDDLHSPVLAAALPEGAPRPRGISAVAATLDAVDVQKVPIQPRVSRAFHANVRGGLRRSALAASSHPPATPSQPAVASSTACSAAGGLGGGTLVWLRPFDLRLHDHPALWYAAQRRRPVHVVFAWSDVEDAAQGEWQLAGTAAAFWLHHAIASLDAALRRRYGLSVAIRAGESLAGAILAAAKESGAEEVATSSACEPVGPAGHTANAAVESALEGAGISFKSFNSFLLRDVTQVRVDMGTYRGHFGTLTPFHHACMGQPPVPWPTSEPAALETPRVVLRSEGLDALGLARMPVRADGSVLDWGVPILTAWDISEEGALAVLRRFLAPGGGLGRYEKGRQLADASAVARISPYLRFGMLSSRLMFHEMKAAGAKDQSIVFWRRLVWRDLAYWQLTLFPRMRDEPIRAHYAGQVWSQDQHALERWQRGCTGYPIVDAGMRQLWATGWMPQNVRMVSAILLCEHLNIHWLEGERWFHHTLVDADPAINAMMWQNAGKSGLDQWNFTMSPATAGRTQDPRGDYVRRWCPELARLPLKLLHTPWEAPEHVLREAGVALGPGGNYPERVITDLQSAARASGDAIRSQRKRSVEWSDAQGYDLLVLPRGSTLAHDGRKFRVFTAPQYRNADTAHGGGRANARDEAVPERGPRSSERGGKGKGKSRGKGRSGADDDVRRRWGGMADSRQAFQAPCRAGTSHQSVLDEYMRASDAQR
uniref:CPD photolyase n=1 Tax=Lingulaulax polyedra TaxID=160621 RepID=A0A516AGH5_LINPO|nr:CPD photolyase [Lingulodinium polyedra]